MNITPQINGYQNNYQVNNTPNFKAREKGIYELFKGTGKATIYQLEKSDIPLLQNFIDNIGKFFEQNNVAKEDDAKQEIILKAFQAGIDFLKGQKHPKDKVKVMLAVVEDKNKTCGVIIGDALKIDKKGKFVYSSRKNHGAKEGEIEFFSTWNNGEFKGVGKSLAGEYFRAAKKDGFKSAYVRSEIPELEPETEKFYTDCGFRRLTKDKKLDLKKGDNPYVAGEYFDPNDEIIPMKANMTRINEFLNNPKMIPPRTETTNPKRVDLSHLMIKGVNGGVCKNV